MGMPFFFGGEPVSIEFSGLFVDGDFSRLVRTNGAAYDSDKVLTLGTYIKRGDTGTRQFLFYVGNAGGSGNLILVEFFTDDKIRIILNGAGTYLLTTTATFSDSDWHKLVIGIDTTQAVAANRVTVEVDDSIEAITGAYPPLNHSFNTGSSDLTAVSTFNGTNAFDGYLAEPFVVDGTKYSSAAVAPGLPGIVFGSLGALLDFSDSGDMGNDVSGNDNDFTNTNVTQSGEVPEF